MADRALKVECPLCEGCGELLRSQVAERFATPELRARIDARPAEMPESAELAGVGPRVRNFEREVHEWNPQLPIWRRSPKE